MTKLQFYNAVTWQKPLFLFTQAELAKELGVSFQRVHSWTKGVEPRPAIKQKLMNLYKQMPENERKQRLEMLNVDTQTGSSLTEGMVSRFIGDMGNSPRNDNVMTVAEYERNKV